MESRSVLSTEYVRYRITAVDDAGAPLDLSGDTVELAFLPEGTSPSSGDWHAASWLAPGLAGLLVGPAGLALAVGTYVGWVRITDSPEVPVMHAGYLELF